MNEAEHSARNTKPRGLRVIEGGPPPMAGRVPPHSDEAEQYLLSCCLLDGSETISRCLMAGLKAAAFYAPSHRLVFEKIIELHRTRGTVELAMLAEELKTSGQLDAVGGFAYLAQISSNIPTTAQAVYFIDKVKELWALRQLIMRCTGAIEAAFSYQGGLRDLVEGHAAEMARAVEFVRGSEETLAQKAERALEWSLRRAEGTEDRSRWLLTGLKNFDERFTPFDVKNGDWLNIIGAGPSIGKSTFVRQLANHNLEKGKKGLVFLLETSLGNWLDLAAATTAKINLRFLPTLPKDLQKLFADALRERHAWLNERLWIHDEMIPVETLIARVEEHTRRHGRPDFVVVDHMHLLRSRQKFHMREPEVAFIANELKACFKRIDTCGWVAAQVNRESKKAGNVRPASHNIRDSGSCEAAADRIILLHRPDTDLRGQEQNANTDQVMMEIIQDKHRNGPTGHREFWMRKSQTLFFDLNNQGTGPVETPVVRVPAGGIAKGDFKRS